MRTITIGCGRYSVKVDDCDYDYLMRWRWGFKISSGKHHRNVYARRNTKRAGGQRATVYMHLEILDRIGLPPLPNETGDHDNNDTLDNQRHNLAWASRSKQNANQRRYKHHAKGKEKTHDSNIGFRNGPIPF